MALRRWKPFLGAFAHIDAAIEAADADGLLSRDEFRSARAQIVEMLCDAGDDDEKAEALCAMLDEAMAGSLATLRVVPPEMITPRVMACGDLIAAIGALATGHSSEQVRGLARDVASGWRAGIEARARVAMDLLDGLRSTPPPPPPTLQDGKAPAAGTEKKQKMEARKIPEEQQQPPHPKKKTAAVSSRRISTAESCGAILPKKTAPVVTTSKAKTSANLEAPRPVQAQLKKPPHVAVRAAAEEHKTKEATKQKLHDSAQPKKPPHVAVSTTAEQKLMKPPHVAVSTTAEEKLMKPPHVAVSTTAEQKKMNPPPVAVRAAEETKMEATKRKLQERYQEAEDAKRRRTIQVIKPPRPPASCAAERRRFVKPSSSLRMGV